MIGEQQNKTKVRKIFVACRVSRCCVSHIGKRTFFTIDITDLIDFHYYFGRLFFSRNASPKYIELVEWLVHRTSELVSRV